MLFLRFIAACFECALHAARQTIALRLGPGRRRRRRAAIAFNREHTYRPIPVAKWMCPTCNWTHKATGRSPFTGLQFPGCCQFAGGHRQDKKHATGARR